MARINVRIKEGGPTGFMEKHVSRKEVFRQDVFIALWGAWLVLRAEALRSCDV